MTIQNEPVLLPVADGSTLVAHVARPASGRAGVGVIVAHELFGVAPNIRVVIDDLASAGYLALAPEFYHRDAPRGHWMKTDDAGREEGFRLLHKLTRQQALDDVAACVSWLKDEQSAERVAMIGFSAGGHLAYLAACRLPISRAAVMYGGWLPTTDIPLSQPTPTLELTQGITGRVLYAVGEDDVQISAAERAQVAGALRTAGVDHEIAVYPGTGHAFFWPGTPSFNERSRDDAWSRVLTLLAS
jgi:carboxymethylenebutenolidase